MNGFGGNVERTAISVLEGLGAIVTSFNSSLDDLGLLPRSVLSRVNETFFPGGIGFNTDELTHETTVGNLIFEIKRKLAAQGKHEPEER